MIAKSLAPTRGVDIATLADEIVGRIAMADALDILVDDRAFIKRVGDIMPCAISLTPRSCAW